MKNNKIFPYLVALSAVSISFSALGNDLVLAYTFMYFHDFWGFPIGVAGIIQSYEALASYASGY